MHVRKISILLLTKAIIQFTFFFLVSNSYLQQRIFFEIEELFFFKKEIFLIMILKYTHYFKHLLETNNIYLTFVSVCTYIYKLHTESYLN